MTPALCEITGRPLPVVEGVHGSLCSDSDASHEVPVRLLLIALADSLRESFADVSQRVRLHVSVDEATLPADAATGLVLVASEAIGNAYRHGFPGIRPGMIAMSLRRTADAMVLEIRDDGVGMMRIPRPGPGGSSLMQSLAKRLSAVISFAPLSRDGGTSVRLWIPRSNRRPPVMHAVHALLSS